MKNQIIKKIMFNNKQNFQFKIIFYISILSIISIIFLQGCKKQQINNNTNDNNIRLLFTSDTHGHFMPFDYSSMKEFNEGSLVQIATAVKEFKNNNTILIDAGDVIEDNYADKFVPNNENDPIHPMILAMNNIGYDIQVLGNHEFNYEMDKLELVKNSIKAEVLCGNVSKNNKKFGKLWTIVEKNGIKVAFIGLVTPCINIWDNQNLKDWDITNPYDEIKKAFEEIGDTADLYIGVFHEGLANELDIPYSGCEAIAKEFPKFDVILSAHTHQAIAKNINNICIVQNKDYAQTMVKVDITIEKNANNTIENKKINPEIIEIKNYKPDQDLVNKLLNYHNELLKIVTKPIAKVVGEDIISENDLNGLINCATEDTNYTKLISDVMKFYANTDIAISSLFMTNNTIKVGDLTNSDILSLYKYPNNTLYIIQLNKKQLLKILEYCGGYYNKYIDGDLTISYSENRPIYTCYVCNGIKYEINISKDVGNRIENLTWDDGREISDDELFTAAINNYMYESIISNSNEAFDKDDERPLLLQQNVRSDLIGIQNMLKQYIITELNGIVDYKKQNMWKVTGTNWDEELHKKALSQIIDGKIKLTNLDTNKHLNIKSIRVDDLIE